MYVCILVMYACMHAPTYYVCLWMYMAFVYVYVYNYKCTFVCTRECVHAWVLHSEFRRIDSAVIMKLYYAWSTRHIIRPGDGAIICRRHKQTVNADYLIHTVSCS